MSPASTCLVGCVSREVKIEYSKQFEDPGKKFTPCTKALTPSNAVLDDVKRPPWLTPAYDIHGEAKISIALTKIPQIALVVALARGEMCRDLALCEPISTTPSIDANIPAARLS